MKKLIVVLAVAVAIPTSVALAKPPATHTNHSKAAPKVMYVLKGTLSNFTPASSTGDGSIMITINHSNYHGRLLKGDTLKFAVAANTRITSRNGTTATTLAPTATAKGMVKFRAPLMKSASGATLAAALPTMAKAFHIIVQG